MDVAIKAGFTVYIGEDRDTEYLITLSGEKIKVPEEKLVNRKTSDNLK